MKKSFLSTYLFNFFLWIFISHPNYFSLYSQGVSRRGLLKLADSDDMRNLLKPRNKEEEEEDRLDAEAEARKKDAA